MFSRHTRQLAQALITVSRMPEWREVDRLLAEELAETTKRLLDAHEPALVGKLQGRAKLLVELRDFVAEAPNALATLKA